MGRIRLPIVEFPSAWVTFNFMVQASTNYRQQQWDGEYWIDLTWTSQYAAHCTITNEGWFFKSGAHLIKLPKGHLLISQFYLKGLDPGLGSATFSATGNGATRLRGDQRSIKIWVKNCKCRGFWDWSFETVKIRNDSFWASPFFHLPRPFMAIIWVKQNVCPSLKKRNRSIEVAFALLTQQPRVRFPPKKFREKLIWCYRHLVTAHCLESGQCKA